MALRLHICIQKFHVIVKMFQVVRCCQECRESEASFTFCEHAAWNSPKHLPLQQQLITKHVSFEGWNIVRSLQNFSGVATNSYILRNRVRHRSIKITAVRLKRQSQWTVVQYGRYFSHWERRSRRNKSRYWQAGRSAGLKTDRQCRCYAYELYCTDIEHR